MAVKCKVKWLYIGGNNTNGEDQQLYSMLSNPSNVLKRLYMGGTKLSSTAASYTDLFTALKNNNSSALLTMTRITDVACDAITAALERSSCLVKLSMYNNLLSSEAILNIVQCLKVNNTLQLLGFPACLSTLGRILDLYKNLLAIKEKAEDVQ